MQLSSFLQTCCILAANKHRRDSSSVCQDPTVEDLTYSSFTIWKKSQKFSMSVSSFFFKDFFFFKKRSSHFKCSEADRKSHRLWTDWEGALTWAYYIRPALPGDAVWWLHLNRWHQSRRGPELFCFVANYKANGRTHKHSWHVISSVYSSAFRVAQSHKRWSEGSLEVEDALRS